MRLAAVPREPPPALARQGVWWALGAIFCWSQTTAIVKISLHTLSWLTVALCSTVIATLCYFIIAAVSGRLTQLRVMPLRQVATLAGVGVSGCFCYTCLMLLAYARGQASEVLIVNYLWPIATVGFAALIARERPGPLEIGGLCFAMLGWLAWPTGRFHVPKALAADLLALGAALSYGVFSAASKYITGDRLPRLLIAYASSAVLFLLTALLTQPRPCGSRHPACNC